MSGILHVLLHMAEHDDPVTSEVLARAMQTNAVVIRRIMAGLREQGYVRSEKGHGGGWMPRKPSRNRRGYNARLLPIGILEAARVRHRDGAGTGEYLD